MNDVERLHTLVEAQSAAVPGKFLLSASLSDDYEEFKDASAGPLGPTMQYERLSQSDSQKTGPSEATRADKAPGVSADKKQGDAVEAGSVEEAKEQCIVC